MPEFVKIPAEILSAPNWYGTPQSRGKKFAMQSLCVLYTFEAGYEKSIPSSGPDGIGRYSGSLDDHPEVTRLPSSWL